MSSILSTNFQAWQIVGDDVHSRVIQHYMPRMTDNDSSFTCSASIICVSPLLHVTEGTTADC